MDYSNYDKRVQNYMVKLEKTLSNEQGKISLSTEVNLDLLAANLDIYFQMIDDIKANGVLRLGKEKQMVRHPILASLNAQNQTILKIINSLGLSPMAKYKMKNLNTDDEDELDDLINE